MLRWSDIASRNESWTSFERSFDRTLGTVSSDTSGPVNASWRVVLAVRWNCRRSCRDHAPHGTLVPTLGPEAGASANSAWAPRFRDPEPWPAPAGAFAWDLRPWTAKGRTSLNLFELSTFDFRRRSMRLLLEHGWNIFLVIWHGGSVDL